MKYCNITTKMLAFEWLAIAFYAIGTLILGSIQLVFLLLLSSVIWAPFVMLVIILVGMCGWPWWLAILVSVISGIAFLVALD